MSWSPPLPRDWPATRRRILDRDGQRCYRCGRHATDVDHIVPRHLGGSDDDDNLAAICRDCHRRKTGREARARRPNRRRPTEPHPGLID